MDAASGDAVGLRRVLGDRRGRGNGQGVHRVARPVCFGLRPAEWPTSLIVALAPWFRGEVEESSQRRKVLEGVPLLLQGCGGTPPFDTAGRDPQPMSQPLELTGPAAPAGEPPSSPLDAIPVDVVCSQEDAALFALADTPTRSRRVARAGAEGGRANSTPTRVPAAGARGVDDEPPSSQPRLDLDEIEHLSQLAAESFEADRRAGTDGVSISPARGMKRHSSGTPISSTGPSEGNAGGVRALAFGTPPHSPLRPRGLSSKVGTRGGADDDIAAAEELTFEEAERRRREEAVRDGRHVDLTAGGADPARGSPARGIPVVKREPGVAPPQPPAPESLGLRPGPGGRMLTRQQRAIVNLAKEPRLIPERTTLNGEIVNGEIIRVTAAAGTGKTFTMEAVAERLLELGHKKVMYVTFTRAQKKDAEARFRKALGERYPGGVEVKTLHALAGELICAPHKERISQGNLERLTLQLFGDDIDEFLCLGGVRNAGFKVRRQRAFWIAKTMVKFLQNSLCENDPKAFDMYYPARLHYEGNSEKRLESTTLEEAERFFRERAKQLYDVLKVDLLTSESKSGKYMHDVIQKQAFLDKCTVGNNCQAVLVDELQDLTQCQIRWMTMQRGIKKDDARRQVFFVGDMAQGIYSFRGARSIWLLEIKVEPGLDLTLTQSFRFKYQIARVANTILYGKMNSPQAKYFRPYKVQGASRDRNSSEVFHYGGQVGPEDAILKLRERCAKEQEQKDRMVTVVSFRNGTLIKAALDVMHKCPDAKIAVCGDKDKETSGRGRYKAVCNHIQAFYDLFKGDTNKLPSTEYFRAFCDQEGKPIEFDAKSTPWESFCEEVDERELNEFSVYIDIIETFQEETMDKVQELKDHILNREPDDCDVLLTTIHTAKGLEWTNVVVLDDLKQLAAFSIVKTDEKGSRRAEFAWQEWGDDFNLWYVAVTRAKRRLVVPRALVDVYDAFDKAKRIAEEDEDPGQPLSFFAPYDNLQDAKTYKPDSRRAPVPQAFTLDEVKLIHELGKGLWVHCDVRKTEEQKNVIKEV